MKKMRLILTARNISLFDAFSVKSISFSFNELRTGTKPFCKFACWTQFETFAGYSSHAKHLLNLSPTAILIKMGASASN